MSLRGFDQFNANDLSALLRAQGGSNNASVASYLLGQHQHHNAAPSLASLAALHNSGMHAAAPPPPPDHQYQSQTTQLLTALLEHQQREDQKKAALIQQLDRALHAPRPPAPAPADNLALLLQQKQMAMPSQGNANPLALLAGMPQISGAAPGANIYGGPSHGGQIDAVAIAKLLQSQQQQASIPPPQVPITASPSTAAALAAHLNGVPAATALLDSAAALSVPADRRRKGRTGTFPQKLHQMLSDLERQEGGTDIASFLPHGRAFAIHKPRDFVKHVMPKYFRMSRFSSFQRQLNLYDFQRITEGPDKGSYYHELFVQGRPILSTMMKRNKIKGVKNLRQQDGEEKAEEKEEPLKEEEEEQDDEDDDGC